MFYSFVGFELTYTIFSALAEVLRGFRMREIAVRHLNLLELTPHHGAHTHLHQKSFGLHVLPNFKLNRVQNVIACRRVTVKHLPASSTKSREVTFVLLIPLGLLVAQLYTMAQESELIPVDLMPDVHNSWMTRRFIYTDRIASPAVDFLRTKLVLVQLLFSGLIGRIVWIGSNVTQMYGHELPQTLMLKKAELQSAGYPSVPSLHYSTDRRIPCLSCGAKFLWIGSLCVNTSSRSSCLREWPAFRYDIS